MRSMVSTRASSQARRAAKSPAARALARAGLAARGVLFVLVGIVAILVAFGLSSHEADQTGALQLLAGTPFGLFMLWLLAFGFAGYALWRLSEVAFGVAGEGYGAMPRLKSLGRAVVYAFFAYLTFTVIAGTAGSQQKNQQDLTAQVMRHSGGQWLVGIAGVIVVIGGLVLTVQGVRREFLKYLDLGRLRPAARRLVEWLGVIGTSARGIVFALAGVLVVEAAVTHKPGKAGGIDKALLTLRNQPFGEILLGLAALGLITFGAYCLCETKWHKV